MAAILSKKHLNRGQKCSDLEWSLKTGTFEIQSSKNWDFKRFWILNGRISDPSCSPLAELYVIWMSSECWYHFLSDRFRLEPLSLFFSFFPWNGLFKFTLATSKFVIKFLLQFRNGLLVLLKTEFRKLTIISGTRLWASLDSWRHLRGGVYLACTQSSRVHICATEYRQLVNLSRINIQHRILALLSLPPHTIIINKFCFDLTGFRI